MSQSTVPPPVAARDAPARAARRRAPGASELVARWGLLGVLAILVAGFSIAEPDTFATGGNFKDILTAQPVAVFIAFAAMVALVAGEYDLSLGANLAFAQYAVVALAVDQNVPWQVAVLLTLLGGLAVGLVNAFLVVRLGLNSFIATIGVSTVLTGLQQWYSHGGSPIFGGAPAGFLDLGQTKLLGIALPVFYALAAAAILWVVLEYTVFGRDLRATGANRQAAFLSGIPTQRSRVVAFAVAGVLASLAGVLLSARIGAAQSDVGAQYLLPAFAAVFLGATAVRPGAFNVWGTVIAILVVAVGITGLQLKGVASWVTPVFNGVVLLIALIVSNAASRRQSGDRSTATADDEPEPEISRHPAQLTSKETP